MTCIFCSIIAGQSTGHVLFRNERLIAFLSLEGHPLIAPVNHVEGLEGIEDETLADISLCAKRIATAVRSATGCDGINLVLSDGRAAGQDVFHVHLHVKPRWVSDDVKLTWNTATLPENDRTSLAEDIRKHMLDVSTD